MRFLSRDWALGGLSDAEHDRRLAQYHEHVEQIRSRLRNGAALLLEEVNLHDAVPKAWSATDAGVRWTLVAGDLRHGYAFVGLHYEGGSVTDTSDERIAAWLSADDVEVWHDEVDLATDGYVHRILLWPDGEFSITFDALRVDRSPALPSDR